MKMGKCFLARLISVSMAIVVLTCIFTPVASAASYTAKSGDQVLWWLVPEDAGGGIATVFTASSKCVTNYFETGHTEGTNVVFTHHEIFACAQTWNGGQVDVDLKVNADCITYTNTSGGTIVCFSPLQSHSGSIIVSPDWIWDDKVSTTTYNTGVARVICKAKAYFNCSDALLNWYQSIDANMTI